jgi:hypothetical protein
MGGDDSQKLLPWRGIHSAPGRKPPAQLRINNVTETAGWNLARGTPSFWPRPQLQTARVTFGKQMRVNSATRRSMWAVLEPGTPPMHAAPVLTSRTASLKVFREAPLIAFW